MKKVLINIAQYKRLDQLKQLVGSIVALEPYSFDWTIRIVNDCPEDEETKEWLTILKDSDFLFSKKMGYPESVIIVNNEVNKREAACHNSGLLYAINNNIDYSILLSNDVLVLTKDWIDSFIDPFEKAPNKGAYYTRVGMVVPNSANITKNPIRRYYYDESIDSGYLNLTDAAITYGCCIKTEMIKQIGFFNEEYIVGGGDIDFCWKMGIGRWGIAIIKDVIFHEPKLQRDILDPNFVNEQIKVDNRLIRRYWASLRKEYEGDSEF